MIMTSRKNSVFDFDDYKKYLRFILENRAKFVKGQRFKLSHFVGCQPAYLTQILNGTAHLSLEQATLTNEFLSHSHIESKYFLYLVHLDRAGTKALKYFYQQELNSILESRLVIANRVESNKSLTPAEQARYYNSWYYVAVDVLVSLPQFKTKEKIAEALNLSNKAVAEILEFLIQIQVLRKEKDNYIQGIRSIHLGKGSPFLNKHHANWRVKALQSLDSEKPGDLHYSSLITCSAKDVIKINDILIEAISEIRELVKDSQNETAAAYLIDLFHII
jgi:uncharacterized protein (TIGR02147 family)